MRERERDGVTSVYKKANVQLVSCQEWLKLAFQNWDEMIVTQYDC